MKNFSSFFLEVIATKVLASLFDIYFFIALLLSSCNLFVICFLPFYISMFQCLDIIINLLVCLLKYICIFISASIYMCYLCFQLLVSCLYIAKLSPKPQPQLGAELALVSIQPSNPPIHPSTHRTSKMELKSNPDKKTKLA